MVNRWEATMSMKTILVPMEYHDAMQSALETALLLGRRCDSYIEGFALRWAINEFLVGDVMGGVVPEKYSEDIAAETKKAKRIFESFMQQHDVPRATETTESLSFGWLDDASEGESFIGSYGRVFDVIVMKRRDEHSGTMHDRAIESGLFESGRPILLSPPLPPRQIATNVLIAWNCSTEQARAIALAMPLLQKADRITVLTVIGGTGVAGPSAEQLIRYLQRNGLVAEAKRVELDSRNTGEAILATAQSLGCDLLIKGAYTQSRLRQWIFGGATQHVLENAALPVLLAN
jgi:nucleotide-binding universal stress UspA family protein